MTSNGISYTEKEYDFAIQQHIPVLAFLMNDGLPLTDQQREIEPELVNKIRAFREKAKLSKLVDFWTSTDELVGKVTTALYKTFNRHPRVGWVRGDKAISETMARELAVLSKENRELRKEIEILQSGIIRRIPQIVVTLNDQDQLSTVINKPILSDYMQVQELSMTDVPPQLLQYVNQQQIQEYNTALPDQHSISEYNKRLETYEYMRTNGISLSITVRNDGNVKANDVRVELRVPEHVLLIRKSDFDQMEPPERPTLPDNPIKKAEKEFNLKSMSTLFGNGLQDLMASFKVDQPSWSSHFFRATEQNDSNYALYFGGHTMNLRVRELLHTYRHTFEDEVVIIPFTMEDFEISVNIVCEEFENPVNYAIPFSVKQGNY